MGHASREAWCLSCRYPSSSNPLGCGFTGAAGAVLLPPDQGDEIPSGLGGISEAGDEAPGNALARKVAVVASHGAWKTRRGQQAGLRMSDVVRIGLAAVEHAEE